VNPLEKIFISIWTAEQAECLSEVDEDDNVICLYGKNNCKKCTVNGGKIDPRKQ
jgi:hypothetical protein